MEDIKVIHKLNENVNQRIALIKDDEEIFALQEYIKPYIKNKEKH